MINLHLFYSILSCINTTPTHYELTLQPHLLLASPPLPSPPHTPALHHKLIVNSPLSGKRSGIAIPNSKQGLSYRFRFRFPFSTSTAKSYISGIDVRSVSANCACAFPRVVYVFGTEDVSADGAGEGIGWVF